MVSKTSEIIITASIALAGVIISASQIFIAMNSQQETLTQTKQARTLDYVSEYRKGAMASARSRIEFYLFGELDDKTREDLQNMSKEDLSWFNNRGPFRDISRDLFDLRTFYEDMYLCVRSDACVGKLPAMPLLRTSIFSSTTIITILICCRAQVRANSYSHLPPFKTSVKVDCRLLAKCGPLSAFPVLPIRPVR